MSWLVGQNSAQQRLAERFRDLLRGPGILRLPGAHDALSALMAKSVGFPALYLSGGAYSASRGWPDLGLINSTELAQRASDLVRATDLPLLVDVDTGYGGPLSAARAARELAEAGVAAVQIEDQAMAKKCGHLDGKALVPAEELQAKILAIKSVAPSMLVAARTDALAVEGIEGVIARSRVYLEAGADLIFPEALTCESEFRAVRAALPGPLLANMTEFGKTPYFSAEQFQAWGYQVVLFPVSSLRVAGAAYRRLFAAIQASGTTEPLLGEMLTRRELYELLGYAGYERIGVRGPSRKEGAL